MRNIVFAMVLLLVSAATCLAGDIFVKVPADEYQQTREQLEALKIRLEALENSMTDNAPATTDSGRPSDAKLKKIARDISEIYDTLDEVETRALLDRVNIGAELRVRMDNFRVRDFDMDGMSMFYDDGEWHTKPDATDERNDGNWSSRMRLNLDSVVSRSVRFHARLALYKNWADATPGYSDDTSRSHRATGDTNLKIDRFYVDWSPRFFVPIAFNFGRLPTTDGPPYEFKDNRNRQSTYPSLIFDGEPDGIVTTLGLERYIGLKNAGLRYFYGLAYQFDDDGDNGGSVLDAAYKDEFKDTRVHGVFFESELPGLRESLMVLSYVHAQDFFVKPPDGTLEDSANLGDMDLLGAHLQVRDLLASGLDLFFSYGYNKSDPDGRTVTMNSTSFGLLSSDGLTKHSGHAYYAGLRYELPIEVLNRPKVGFEYNKGSQYWFSFTPGSSEVINKLATRGEVFEYYYIQPLNKNMFLRTGYIQLEYDYAGSGSPLGPPADYAAYFGKQPKLDNLYFMIDCSL